MTAGTLTALLVIAVVVFGALGRTWQAHDKRKGIVVADETTFGTRTIRLKGK